MPQFQDDSGKFDPVKFNKFYDGATRSYQVLSENSYNKNLMSEAEFSANNIWAPQGAKKRTQPQFAIVKVNNPDRRKIGVEGFGFMSDPTMTAAEIAQNEKIFDPKTNT